MPWGAWAPVLALVFVVAPVLGVSIALGRLNLLDEHGDPVGVRGACALLVLAFAAVVAVVLM